MQRALGLADVAPSAAASIGVPGFIDTLGIGDARHCVIALIDGLGWNALNSARAHAPFLSAHADAHQPLRTVFPSTTPAGLGSLGTGLLPGAHGLVGASFWLPEDDMVLAPLQWKSDPLPAAVQPEPTVFERVSAAGARMSTIAPGAYSASGLTRAVLRGGEYRSAETADDRIEQLRSVDGETGPALTYAYWAQLDRIGHTDGAGSPAWLAELNRVDDFIARMHAALGPDAAIVVTADHGMVNISERVDLDADAQLLAGLAHLAGEPRARHAYAQPGQATDLARRWTEALAGKARVLTRDEVLESGLMGAVDPDIAERIGDVVAIAADGIVLASSVDQRVSALIGQHGALTEDEVLIPGLVLRT